MRISFCLITLNEEARLPRCLESIASVADEIVVVDSGSRDATRKIAESYGAIWREHGWEGFATQKNRAHELATEEWIFSMDADEVLSAELQTEIAEWKKREPAAGVNGFSCPRLAIYEGKWISHGDWYPNRRTRLFRRGCGKFTGGLVHQTLEVSGVILPLRGDLLHYSFAGREDHRRKSDHYAKIWAISEKKRGRTCLPWTPLMRAATRWVRGYIFRRGFLDGRQGWVIARLNAREVYWKYRRLRENI